MVQPAGWKIHTFFFFACNCFFSVLSHTWWTQLRCEFNNWDPYVGGAPVPTGLPCRRSCLLTCPNLSLLLTFTYLLSIIFSLLAEFSRSLLPRPRRLLLLVNPFSGRGQAMQWCQTHILPMIREANISYNLIQTGNKTGPRHSHETNETWMWSIYISMNNTCCLNNDSLERQNHARELIREISLPEWDGIIIVSGDGLLHEVGHFPLFLKCHKRIHEAVLHFVLFILCLLTTGPHHFNTLCRWLMDWWSVLTGNKQ